MSERIAYQFNGDHVLKFAGMEKLTGEQVADELNRLYTIIVEQNEEIAALEREVDAFCGDSVLTLGEKTFSTEIDEQLAEDIIQFAQRLYSRWVSTSTERADFGDGGVSAVRSED